MCQYLTIHNALLKTESSSVFHSKNGLLIWIIENISEEICRSCSNRGIPIDSPRFSSLTGKHPLNARLYLHGDKENYPKYISIYIILNPGGTNNLDIPLTCSLVDQTNNYQHILRRVRVHLNQNNIGSICKFSKFIQAIEVHKEDSKFVKNGSLCLIVKLHEDQANEYNHYSPSIQNAVQQINSSPFS